MQYTDELLKFFPHDMRPLVGALLSRDDTEEIHLRQNKPVQAVYSSSDELFPDFIVTKSDCEYLKESFCEHSVYSCEDDMRNGFITLPVFGLRIGISGDCFAERGRVIRFRSVSGFCLRIAHEHKGCAGDLCRATDGLKGSCIIASPPAGGKTTVLRDMARVLSDEYKRKVCIVDERSEIAGGTGTYSFDVGMRTDVLDNCPKSEGMLMALRTLSPDVIITDEIGQNDDFTSIHRALSSGVSVAVSIHADNDEKVSSLCGDIADRIRYRAFIRRNGDKRLLLFHDTYACTRAVYSL